MSRRVLYGLLALLLSVFYLTGSLELDEDEVNAHYQQEQVSTICTAVPDYTISVATVIAWLSQPKAGSWCQPLIATPDYWHVWLLLRESAPPKRRYIWFGVFRL